MIYCGGQENETHYCRNGLLSFLNTNSEIKQVLQSRIRVISSYEMEGTRAAGMDGKSVYYHYL